MQFVLGNSDFIQPNTGKFWEALPVFGLKMRGS